MEVQEKQAQKDRVLTIPNILSMARLVGVPVFLWLILMARVRGSEPRRLGTAGAGPQRHQRLSGRQARPPLEPDQQSRPDPRPGRRPALHPLHPSSASPGARSCRSGLRPHCWRGSCCCSSWSGSSDRHGYAPPQVNFLGKAATFNLMYAFPLLLLSDGSGWIASLAAVFGWAFAGWGTALYWWAGILYVVQVRRLIRADTAAD